MIGSGSSVLPRHLCSVACHQSLTCRPDSPPIVAAGHQGYRQHHQIPGHRIRQDRHIDPIAGGPQPPQVGVTPIIRDARPADEVHHRQEPADGHQGGIAFHHDANMVALGAYVACSKVVSLDVLEKIVRQEFAKKPKFVEGNVAALKRGAEVASKEMEKAK